MLAFGWAMTGKQFVGYTYLIELMPHNKQVLIGSAEFMTEAIVYLLCCAYFVWVSKVWYYF